MNLPKLDCSQVGSLEYRRLCQTLSLPPLGERRPSTFTGIPATDILVLQELPDKDLISVCATDKYLNDLCNNESFWLNRTLNSYRDQLGSGSNIREKYIPDGTSWKDYYIWVTGLLDGPPEIATLIATDHNRNDLKILLGIEDAEPGVAFGMGFKTPIYINNNLRGFLSEADLGRSDPSKPSLPLNQFISAISTGISNRAELTPLFNIYVKVNKMQLYPHEKQFLTATPLMYKWFGNTFAKIRSKFSYFDPEKFRFADLQGIIHSNIIPKDTLTPEQMNRLEDPEIVSRLHGEKDMLSRILQIYRQ